MRLLPQRKYHANVTKHGGKYLVHFLKGSKLLACPTCDSTVQLVGKAGGGTATLTCDCKKRAVPGYQVKDLVERLERGDVP